MSGFGDRERGFEGKFAHDSENEFRAVSRRNHMLGEWAAKLMGLENVEAYARAIVKSEVDQPSDVDVQRKIHQDLLGAGLTVSQGEIASRMDEFLAVARGQVAAGV